MTDQIPPQHVRVVVFLDFDGAGRLDSHVADLACLLVHARQQVMVFDAGSRGNTSGVRGALCRLPRVDLTSSPDVREVLAALDDDLSWQARGDKVRVWHHFLPLGVDALALVTLDAPLPVADRESFLSATRSAIDRSPYDLVLVAGLDPTTATDLATSALALADVVVAHAAPTETALRDAGQQVRRLLPDGRGDRRLVPAVTLSDGAEALPEPTRRALGQAFAAGAGADPAPIVALAATAPSAPGREGVLATLAGDAAETGHLALLAAVTGQARPAPDPVPDAVRQRYLRRLAEESDGSAPGEAVWLAYSARHRPWAEWVGDVLNRSGIAAERLTGDSEVSGRQPAVIMTIGHPEDLPAPVRQRMEAMTGEACLPPGPDVTPMPVEPGGVRLLDPSGRDTRLAEARLRGWLLLPGRTARPADGSWTSRLPSALPERQVTNSAPPVDTFVGREPELDAVRDALTSTHVCLVTGDSGAGKRELTATYANCYAHDYDVVWWIPAQDPSVARNGLRTLSRQLLKRDDPAALLAALAAGDPVRRWLLIYHNVDDLHVLDGLLPVPSDVAGGDEPVPAGHVLVVSRGADSAELGRMLGRPPCPRVDLRPFDEALATQLLARRIALLPEAEARALAAELRYEPLALRLAAATLDEAVPGLLGLDLTAGRLARGYLAELAAEEGTEPVGRALQVTLRTLDRGGPTGRLAAALARMCAFVSAEGLSLALLRHGAMLAQLVTLTGVVDADELVRDNAVIDSVVWLGVRNGLFEMDTDPTDSPTTRRVRMHRVVQEQLRAIMSERERTVVRSALLLGLAGCAPSDAELVTESQRVRMVELGKHLRESDAAGSTDRRVQQWLAKQIQFTARYGDPHERGVALSIADDVLDRWTAAGTDEDLLLRLEHERAVLRWELKEFDAAIEAQERVQQRTRRLLGPDHVRTLFAARSLGRYLRGVGRFADARLWDNVAYEGFRRRLGDGHEEALRAANNLAFSAFLVGDVREAVRLQERTMRLWVEQSGWEGPMPWQAAASLGRYLRELQRYREAVTYLNKAEALARKLSRDAANAPHVQLRIARDLAIIHRLTGLPGPAQDSNRSTLSSYRSQFGDTHPETLACELAVAMDERVRGHFGAAAARAQRAVANYAEVLPAGHPYLHLARTNLSAFQLAAGAVGQARQNADEALRGLRATMGDAHPWVCAASVNRLAALAAGADLVDLEAQLDNLVARCARLLTRGHAYTRVAMANRSDPRRQQTIVVDIPSFL